MSNEIEPSKDHSPVNVEIASEIRLRSLIAMSRILSDTIRGCGMFGEPGVEMAKPIIAQLESITKRITWIEKTGDPSYTPFDAEAKKKFLHSKKVV